MRDEQLLCYIQNMAQRNKSNISSLIKHSNDKALNEVLNSHYLQYTALVAHASNKLVSCGIAPKYKGAATRLTAALMLNRRHTVSKYARALVQETANNLTCGFRKIKKYSGNNEEIITLAHDLLQTEMGTIQNLSKFM